MRFSTYDGHFLDSISCTLKLFLLRSPPSDTPLPVNREIIDWYMSHFKIRKGGIFGSAAGVIPRPNMKRNGRPRSIQ